METYIARSKKEFIRVAQLLCCLNIKWINKCGWNIEIQSNPAAAAPELLEALKALFKECAMIHKYGGSDCNQKQSDAAIKDGQDAITKAESL